MLSGPSATANIGGLGPSNSLNKEHGLRLGGPPGGIMRFLGGEERLVRNCVSLYWMGLTSWLTSKEWPKGRGLLKLLGRKVQMNHLTIEKYYPSFPAG